MTLLVMLSTPTSGATRRGAPRGPFRSEPTPEAKALEKLLNDTDGTGITESKFRNFLKHEDPKKSEALKDQLVTQIFVWQGQTIAYKDKIKSYGLTTCKQWMQMNDRRIAQGAFNYYTMVKDALDARARAERQRKEEIKLQAIIVLNDGAEKIGLDEGLKERLRNEIKKDLLDLVKDDPPKPKFELAPLSLTARDTLDDFNSKSQKDLHDAYRLATSGVSPSSDSSNADRAGSPAHHGTRR